MPNTPQKDPTAMQLLSRTVLLSRDHLYALHEMPVELVPAVTGKTIVPFRFVLWLHAGQTAYDLGEGAGRLVFSWTNGADIAVPLLTNLNLGALAGTTPIDTWSSVALQDALLLGIDPPVGLPVSVSLRQHALTLGDGVVEITTLYRLV
jgi:hypothetical protein